MVTLATLLKYQGDQLGGFAGFGGALVKPIQQVPDHVISTPLFLYHGEIDDCIALKHRSYDVFAQMTKLT